MIDGVPSRRQLLGGGAAALAMPWPAGASGTDRWAEADAIRARVRPPVFPARTVSIVEHGARGDGATLNTRAIASAIDAVAAAGGGRLLVPAGDFLTGAIHLRSNVDLHVSAGATLRFSTDPAHYPIVLTRFEGMEMMGLSPLIYAYRQTNVAVTGHGTLDGQGSARNWWSWKGAWRGTVDHGWRPGMPEQGPARARLSDMVERRVPVEKRVFTAGDRFRPSFIEPYACQNVLIEGVRLRGAPFWQVHPVLCLNVTIRDLDIYGHGPNNDGCDPESCRDLVIERVTFDTGDDCIAIKSGRNEDGRRIGVPSENIVIADCLMREGHGGVTVGSEISGGCRNVFAERCRMDSPNLDFAIRFKNNAMRGGLLEHFSYRDIDVGQVKQAVIACDFNYEEGARGRFRPVLRDIVIERLRAKRAGQVLDAQGLPGAPVQQLTIRDSVFDGVVRPSEVRFTESLVLDRVRVNGADVRAL